MNSGNKALGDYFAVITEAGRLRSAAELVAHVRGSRRAIEQGMLASIELYSRGDPEALQEAFCLLDAGKALVAKNLIHRRDIERAGREQPDVLLSMPNPSGIATYLNARSHDTAIVSLHVIESDKVAVFIARGGDPEAEIHSMPGFGGVYYDAVYIDGVKKSFLAAVENYANGLVSGTPSFDPLRGEFDFLSKMVFMLLFKPRPPKEVIFIPHKLYNVLPLHAISTSIGGRRIYLHDVVQVISYASCLQELFYAGSFQSSNLPDTRGFLRVSDRQSDLAWLEFERSMIDVTSAPLSRIGVRYDVAETPHELPTSFDDYIWINWSSHARSHPTEWGESFLQLGSEQYAARSIATTWSSRNRPVVVLAGCETSVDISSGYAVDESFGLDLAFRVAGARASVASLWQVEDPVAALTAVILPAWHFQFGLAPDVGLTALQRHFATGTWKNLLLRDEQILALPLDCRDNIASAQEELWNYPDESFHDETSWASFRCHGR